MFDYLGDFFVVVVVGRVLEIVLTDVLIGIFIRFEEVLTKLLEVGGDLKKKRFHGKFCNAERFLLKVSEGGSSRSLIESSSRRY